MKTIELTKKQSNLVDEYFLFREECVCGVRPERQYALFCEPKRASDFLLDSTKQDRGILKIQIFCDTCFYEMQKILDKLKAKKSKREKIRQ